MATETSLPQLNVLVTKMGANVLCHLRGMTLSGSLWSDYIANAIDADSSRNRRFREFQEWTHTVRDPAQQASEGVRQLKAAGAIAEYEIAPIPDGRYAVRVRCEYSSGNLSGKSCPWTPFESRDECVQFFLTSAKRHFEQEHTASNCNERQQKARRQMLDLMNGGLFGFIEPAVR